MTSEKETLPHILAIKTWHCFLEGTPFVLETSSVSVFTDASMSHKCPTLAYSGILKPNQIVLYFRLSRPIFSPQCVLPVRSICWH